MLLLCLLVEGWDSVGRMGKNLAIIYCEVAGCQALSLQLEGSNIQGLEPEKPLTAWLRVGFFNRPKTKFKLHILHLMAELFEQHSGTALAQAQTAPATADSDWR